MTATATRRRYWTPAELDAVRSRYGTQPTEALAADLGRTATAVYLKAAAIGLAGERKDSIDWTPAVDARFRALHARGFTDTAIAAKLGCERLTVARHRRAAGLPTNARSARERARYRRQLAAQLGRLGVATLTEMKERGRADFVRAYGLPEDLRLRHVQIVALLAARGPLTKRAVAEGIGLTWNPRTGPQKALHSADAHHTYLGGLIARGLAVRIRLSVPGGGRGRFRGPQNVYALTPACLDLLAAAGRGAAS